MRIKKILGLSACMITVILAAGCGNSEDRTGRTAADNRNDVQAVLEQGISETVNVTETPEPDAPVIAESIESISKDDALPDPVNEPEPETAGGTDEDYVDLTVLSGTMVYSEVYDMMCYPENYVGKTVKMSGMYAVYIDDSTGMYYHACIISDATACCSQGIEFELTEDYTYPDDYPEEGSEICVEGVFDTYQEGEYTYCTLRNSRIQKL